MGSTEGQISFSNMNFQVDTGSFSGGDREWRRLKFEAGHSYRIKFIDNSVEMRHRHFNPVEGKSKGYYRCLAHTGYCPVCQAAANGFGGEGKYKLKKAQEIFGANILVYNTDINGNPVQPLNAEVYFWAFNGKKFQQIRSIQQDWGDITKIDLKLTCADAQAAQFQDVSISNLPQCLYEMDLNFKAACDAKIAKDKYPLAKMLCKEVDLMGIIQAFGLPQQYIPQGMLATMPQGQTTVMDMANGTQPTQSIVPSTQPVVQAPQSNTATFPQGGLNYGTSAPAPAVESLPFAMPNTTSVPASQMQAQPQASVQPIASPTPAMTAPSQVSPVQAPADTFADLDALQDMLG